MNARLMSILGVAALIGAIVGSGCKQKQADQSSMGEKAGEAVETATAKDVAEDAKDATGKAMEKTGEVIQKAGDKVEESGKAIAPPAE